MFYFPDPAEKNGALHIKNRHSFRHAGSLKHSLYDLHLTASHLYIHVHRICHIFHRFKFIYCNISCRRP